MRPRVRILLDYRPALRAADRRRRVRAPARRRAGAPARGRGQRWYLFSSSWKDRLPADVHRRRVGRSTRGFRSRLLNLAWHRLGWPPVETFAGAGRRRPVAAPAPDARHGEPRRSSPSTTSISSIIPERHARRDPPRLPGAGRVARPARRTRVIAVSAYTARPGPLAARRPDRAHHVCPPGAPSWHAQRASRPRTAPSSSWARSSRARMSARCFGPTPNCSRAGPAAPPLVLAGRRDARAAPCSTSSTRAAARRPCPASSAT